MKNKKQICTIGRNTLLNLSFELKVLMRCTFFRLGQPS
jgi:hypothetical protein